jgi:hypothetical protein
LQLCEPTRRQPLVSNLSDKRDLTTGSLDVLVALSTQLLQPLYHP